MEESGSGTGSATGFPAGSPFGVDNGTGTGGWGPGNGPPGIFDGLPSLDQPRVLSSGVSPPKRVFYVQPVYPEAARASRLEGTVIMEVVIGRTGAVEEVKVLKSSPLFDAAAVEAVKRWKYEPALLGGSKPLRVFMTVRVEFRLK
jgi:protein TonB